MKSAKTRLILGVAVGLFAIGGLIAYVANQNVPVLMPKGTIANDQLNLMLLCLALSLIVVIPVFILTIYIGFKYRETNKKADYRPEWSGNPILELIWWGIPAAIIFVIGITIWQSSYALDPYKKLDRQKPLNVQVVALNWKWLFIYPEYNIASLNYFKFPQNRPIQFDITSDGPMNSFWIPALGGQIYAMPGMSSKLNLKANTYDDFRGSSANLSGRGFASMTFDADSTTDSDFNSWVKQVGRNGVSLNESEFEKLSQPKRDLRKVDYNYVPDNLYHDILMKYMQPDQGVTDDLR